jgi:hypothetical protein
MIKNKILFLFLSCSFLYAPDLYAPEKTLLIKPRTKRIQKSTGDIKQAIATECDEILTSSLSLINSLTECIDVIRKKLKALISGSDDFFSNQKAKELELYKKDIQTLRITLKKIEIRLDKEIKNLDTNFSK